MRKFLVPCFVLFCVVIINFTTFAFSGWNFIDGQFVYLNEEGKKVLNTFMESQGNKYYLGEDGFIVRNRIFEYSGEFYYVDVLGRQVVNDYVRIDETNNDNRDFEDGVYYFDEKGRAVRRRGSSFRRLINGHMVGFDEYGKILTGWLDKDGNRIDDQNIFTEGYYYANGDGILLYNTWYKFSDDLGFYISELGESNVIAKKYDDMNGIWVYFDKNGKKIAGENGNKKSRKINGKSYAFDENGVMVEGFIKNGALDISQASNPTLQEKVKLYDNEEGDLSRKNWVQTVPSKEMSEEDNADDVKSWFYVDSSGNIINNIIKKIQGKKYVFDGIGRMKTGFAMVTPDGKFSASYKPEELTRDDFIYNVGDEGSHLFGSDLNNLYYFGLAEEESGTGEMCVGDVKIELKDGIYDFKFKDKGMAYGEHTTLVKKGTSYYINGLKLCAWDDTKYGIVKVSDSEYQVVNDKGVIIKAKKKLIKDEFDNYIVILNNRCAGYIANTGSNIKIKWRNAKVDVEAGYYYYNNDIEVKDYVGMAVSHSSTCPSPSQLDSIPTEMRVNYH